MTIDTLREHKRKMQNKIKLALDEFSVATGVPVGELEIEYARNVFAPSYEKEYFVTARLLI